MGMIIYVSSALFVREGSLNDEMIGAVKAIKNAWGYPTFKVNNERVCSQIDFNEDQMEGCTPYEDGVLNPLKELCELMKHNNFNLVGDVFVGSDCYDYDNITVRISNNMISTGNTQIINADTDELVHELESRGLICVKIDAENARKALALSSGSPEEADSYNLMTDDEIKRIALKHTKCWGIKRYCQPVLD